MVEGMKWLVDRESSLTQSAPRTHLASYHILQGDTSAARELLKPRLESAFDLLSDDYDYNDEMAYYYLGCTLAQLGDDANALAAFSLNRPPANKFEPLAYLLDFEQESTKSAWAEGKQLES
ncbi:nacht and tpr domain containing protein [Colletotrichum sp. SAR11_59]|nr:nacht and tpr domain containing protein [Colletotrichum sp. SAR11_59]